MLRFDLSPRVRVSLTALFVTALLGAPCGWLEWQRQIVLERQAVKEWVRDQGGREISGCGGVWTEDSWFPDINWVRQLFGDDDYGLIGVKVPRCTPEERARFEHAFPETRLVTDEDFRHWHKRLLAAHQARQQAQQQPSAPAP